MLCERCRGLLVCEIFTELNDEISTMCPATRCLNCGDVEDAVIRANHRRPPMAQQSVPHRIVRRAEVLWPQAAHYGSI